MLFRSNSLHIVIQFLVIRTKANLFFLHLSYLKKFGKDS